MINPAGPSRILNSSLVASHSPPQAQEGAFQSGRVARAMGAAAFALLALGGVGTGGFAPSPAAAAEANQGSPAGRLSGEQTVRLTPGGVEIGYTTQYGGVLTLNDGSARKFVGPVEAAMVDGVLQLKRGNETQTLRAALTGGRHLAYRQGAFEVRDDLVNGVRSQQAFHHDPATGKRAVQVELRPNGSYSVADPTAEPPWETRQYLTPLVTFEEAFGR